MSARTQKLKGQANQVKGKVKKTAGRATGNDRMEASGRADVTEGKGQAAVGGVRLKVKEITKKIAGK